MSTIPFGKLRSASSPELKGYPITKKVTTSPFYFDSMSQYLGVWSQVIVRNQSSSSEIQYRTQPQGSTQVMPPNSERVVAGWGSFFECIGVSIEMELEFNIVNMADAYV